MVTELFDYDGPRGLRAGAGRRRIAVAADAAGRLCLVRPDSVVLEFDVEAYDAVASRIEGDDGLDFLGGRPHQPPRVGLIGARGPRPAHRRRPPVEDVG